MELFKTRPSKITEGLFLGNSEDAKDLELLKELDVKYILIAGNCLTIHFPKIFEYKQLQINDNPFENIEKYFDEAYEFIRNGIREGGCLVHCAMGVSRSASMVVAYFMKENLWKFEDAYNFVKKQRSIVYPNYGFQKQLKKYEIKLGLLTEEEFLTFLNQRPNIFMNQLLSK